MESRINVGGIRRFQNEDGSLTTEGRIRYSRAERKEIRAENRKAFALGREATIAGRAMGYAINKELANAKKYDAVVEKNPDGSKKADRLLKKEADLKETRNLLMDDYEKKADAARAHAESLIQKYGKENVKDVAFTMKKNSEGDLYPVVNEEVTSGAELAASVLVSAGSFAVSVLTESPVFFMTYPKSANQLGYNRYKTTHRAVQEKNKKR